MPTVYIETSIISFLRENPKAATDSILRQQTTRAWWDFHRERYELLTAQYVVDEASAGNTVFAAERLKYLAQIPLLPIGEDIDRLASEILSRSLSEYPAFAWKFLMECVKDRSRVQIIFFQVRLSGI